MLREFVVAHFLGVLLADRARFGRWTDAIVSAGAGGNVLSASRKAVAASPSRFARRRLRGVLAWIRR